jgi:uncharacterized protein YprB with RNaseH-like and TPR domain
MLLEEKLRHLRSAIVAPATTEPASARPVPHRLNLDLVLCGSELETSRGTCYLVERRFPISHRHGTIPLGAGRGLSPRTLALLARAMSVPVSGLNAALFLDTETTGLAGGTGTYAFLVGMGFFQDDAFLVRQYFMRDYEEEAALLEAVAGLAGRFELVVTFNGKSFDLPLLESRYAMSRRPAPLGRLVHLDLLHPSRRLWRQRLDNCRLTSLETHLGHQRAQDVPSWVIPSLYFSFVRGGDPLPIAQVFEHNVQDLLSLACLVARLGALLEDPLRSGEDAEEVFQVGRLLEEAGRLEEAAAAYTYAWERAADGSHGQAAALQLAALHKRNGRAELAAPIWSTLAAAGSAHAVYACVELAKHFEHRLGDHASALEHTLHAIDRLELLYQLRPGDFSIQQERRALEHRVTRLTRRKRVQAVT